MELNIRIEEEMTDYPSIVSKKTTVAEASAFMKEAKIRHLPVLDHGQVIGIVSERDLKQAEILFDAMTLFVTDVMTPNPYCVKVGTSLSTVAREMVERKVGCAIVLSAVGRIAGIFTTTDGLRSLSELLESEDPSKLRQIPIEKFLGRNTMECL